MKDKSSLSTPNQASMIARRRKPLISAAFIGLALSSVSVVAHAADSDHQVKPAFTLSVVNHGEGSNRSDNMSEPKRQDNRRTDSASLNKCKWILRRSLKKYLRLLMLK